MKTKTIVIANQKGGVGKSTTAIAMAAILEQKGFKTLFIDTDPQCNSSGTYRAKVDGEATLFDVILESPPIPVAEAIQKTNNGDIVASDPLMRNADKILDSDVNGIFNLKDQLDELKKENKYDYIIIDTNPSLNKMLISSLIASDDLIIPVMADLYSIEGLMQFQVTLDAVKKRFNPDIRTTGLLLIKFNKRTRLGAKLKEQLEEIAKDLNTSS